MTLGQFFEKLEQTPRDWKFMMHPLFMTGMIRSGSGIHCPLSRVGRVRGLDAFSAGERLGLRKSTVNRIVTAADGEFNFDLSVRERLLQACGLL